jgi:hypothetical protein
MLKRSHSAFVTSIATKDSLAVNDARTPCCKCDGYAKEGSCTPPTSLLASIMAVEFPSASSDDLQERRTFDIFRSETLPTIVGFLWVSIMEPCATASSKEPSVSQAVLALGALHERLFISLLPVDTPSEQLFRNVSTRKLSKNFDSIV